MENVFIFLLNNSITAGYLVIVIMLLRPLLKKAPKYIRCILWSFVGLRLVLPFSVKSIFSLIPSAEPIPQEILYDAEPAIHTGISFMNSAINPILSESMAPNPGDSVNPLQVVTAIAWNVWLLGVLTLVIYALVSYIRLRRKLREAVKEQDNIWLCDRIPSPFLLGIFRPRIYLPSGLPESDREYVIAHEKAHIRRKDHWWKPLGFLLLTVYWFNPLMWVAYIFLCRDIEFACDEKVMNELGSDCKASYSEALIHCSVPRKMVSACPVAFGEEGVKGRIKSVLNYKKPAFWIILIALVICSAVALCFLTNPPGTKDFTAKYETGKCLYNFVVSEEKETKNNATIFDIHENFEVYQHNGTKVAALGKLTVSDFSAEDLNKLLAAQGAEKIRLGRTQNAFEISDASGNLQYVFFQKTNGKLISVSFFSDGRIMSVFRLTNAGQCTRVHAYTFQAEILEIREDSLLVAPLEGQETSLADQVVVHYPSADIAGMEYAVGDWVQIDYDGMVQELYPPILPNVYMIYNLNYFSSYIDPSDLQDSYDELVNGATWDIDKDGIPENIMVSPGPTSGVFSFVITAYENGIPEYRNTFASEWFNYELRTEPDGKVILAGPGNNDKEIVLQIGVEDDNVVLSGNADFLSGGGSPDSNTLSQVRKNYPHFLNLPTGKGLEVYVWNNGTWRCGVRGGTNRNADISELHAFRGGTTLEEMAIILGTYSIPKEEIAILYSYNPAFSGENPTVPTEQQQAYIEESLSAYLPVRLSANPYLPPEFPVQNTYPLVICAYQLAENHWRFQFYKNSTIFDATQDAVMGVNGSDLENAKEKLAKFNLPPEDIPVIVVSSYISSYYYEITEQTVIDARSALGL